MQNTDFCTSGWGIKNPFLLMNILIMVWFRAQFLILLQWQTIACCPMLENQCCQGKEEHLEAWYGRHVYTYHLSHLIFLFSFFKSLRNYPLWVLWSDPHINSHHHLIIYVGLYQAISLGERTSLSQARPRYFQKACLPMIQSFPDYWHINVHCNSRDLWH